MPKSTPEAAFETAVEAVLFGDGYTRVDDQDFDRERAIFPAEALESLFIERMELNEALFTDYMGKPEMQELVSKWLGSQVYGRLSPTKRCPASDAGANF